MKKQPNRTQQAYLNSLCLRRMNQKKGLMNFTLIELLVVIAVIAILMSILFPALKSALESSKRTVCRSNLKQMYFGVFQHYEDNDSKLYFARQIDPSFNTGDCKYQYVTPSSGIGMSAWIFLTRRKYIDKNLHVCPSAKYKPVYYGAMYDGLHYGYRYNSSERYSAGENGATAASFSIPGLTKAVWRLLTS